MSGGVGVLERLGEGGFVDVGEVAVCFQTMAKTMKSFGGIRDNVEADSINAEKCVKELPVVTMTSRRSEGESARAPRGHRDVFGDEDEWRRRRRFPQRCHGTRGYRDLQGGQRRQANSLKMVQKFAPTAVGQISGALEEIYHRLVKEVDLDKEMEKSTAGLRGEYGDDFDTVSGC